MNSFMFSQFIFSILIALFILPNPNQGYKSSNFLGASRSFITNSKSKTSLLIRNSSKLPTLSGDTAWNLFITLQNNGKTISRASAKIRFVEDRNYEPPQGKVFIESDTNSFIKSDDRGFSGVWTLSEDKNDRKDGLWIWGLFKEPKYPYLYFNLDVHDTLFLDSGEEIIAFDTSGIPNNRMFFRFNHSQDRDNGLLLSGGEINVKNPNFVNADPLGLGGIVDIGDMVDAGQVDLRPI